MAATLLATWFFGMAAPDSKKMLNVLVIVVGIVISSFGELKFDLIGFLCMCSPLQFNHARKQLTFVYSPGQRHYRRGCASRHGPASAVW